MTIHTLVAYLGRHVDELLRAEPFSGWRVVRSVETDPDPEVWYEFEARGVEVICDERERIKSMFLHRGEGESLAGVPFSTRRQDVLARFGTPTTSGGPVRIPVLGDRGAWDRFTLPEGALHVQYRADRDEIDLITLIRPDAVP